VTTFLILFITLFTWAVQTPSDAPTQPIPFSHRAHAGTLKLKCQMCHQTPANTVDSGDVITLPPVSRCMECHSAVKTDSPAIRKLADAAKEGKEIEWVPVYQLDGDAKFNHKAHLDKGTACAVCHGKVEEREQLYQEIDLSMGTCMDCHRAKQASIACAFCHDHK
jgi:hypothetical protein